MKQTQLKVTGSKQVLRELMKNRLFLLTYRQSSQKDFSLQAAGARPGSVPGQPGEEEETVSSPLRMSTSLRPSQEPETRHTATPLPREEQLTPDPREVDLRERQGRRTNTCLAQ